MSEKKHVKSGGDEIEVQKLPSRLLMLKNYVFSLRMPSQSCGSVTKSFKEGQMVYDPDWIEKLLAACAPVEKIA